MGNARGLALAVLLISFFSVASLPAVDRVPRPEFESDYTLPVPTTPQPRGSLLEYLDVAVLVLFLAAASYFSIFLRSRSALFWLSALAVGYFGFFRKGCVCPIGAIQNVALAIFNPAYTIPLTVILFFILPLIATLLFGRTFCSSVCPLGSLQDLVVYKPVKVPHWLAKPLRFLPVLYLGFSVLFAATGSDFIICRFDPFVSFFRLGGSFGILLLGAAFLVIGLFVARPYCRFLCPYGLILSWISRFSIRAVTITPDTCIQCRLCEHACPVDAIQKPTPRISPIELPRDKRQFAVIVLLLPLLVSSSTLAGIGLHRTFSRINATVRLAERIQLEVAGSEDGTTLESETFRASKKPVELLYAEADAVVAQFRIGSAFLGAFIGIGFFLFVLGLYRHVKREDFQPHGGDCVSCGRCFSYCPKEQVRRRQRARIDAR